LERTEESFFLRPIDDRKYHPPVGAVEIIPQGAFEQASDLFGVVAKRTTAQDLNPTTS
jgi:hypothetical protein